MYNTFYGNVYVLSCGSSKVIGHNIINMVIRILKYEIHKQQSESLSCMKCPFVVLSYNVNVGEFPLCQPLL